MGRRSTEGRKASFFGANRPLPSSWGAVRREELNFAAVNGMQPAAGRAHHSGGESVGLGRWGGAVGGRDTATASAKRMTASSSHPAKGSPHDRRAMGTRARARRTSALCPTSFIPALNR